MLTGLFAPTAGSIDVFGHDLESNPHDARRLMGVCPQHDVLFEKLTCIEHLRIFAGIKGADGVGDEELEELLKLSKRPNVRNHIQRRITELRGELDDCGTQATDSLDKYSWNQTEDFVK